MKNRDNILRALKKDIGSGKVHIVFTPKGVDSDSFILNDLKTFLENEYPNGVLFYSSADRPKFDIGLLSSLLSSDKRAFLLIRDLSEYEDPLSIINLFYDNKDIDVIATTSIHIDRLAGKEKSDIRGRYLSYFYPPYLYEDADDGLDSIADMLDLQLYGYKHKAIAEKVYYYILQKTGQIMSFRDIYSDCGDGVSLVTFVEIINYLHYAGLFYILRRVEIDNLKEIDYGYAFYPSRGFDMLSKEISKGEDERQKGYYDSLLISKAFYEGCDIYRAFHTKKESEGNRKFTVQLNGCFLVVSGNRQILLKTDYFTKDDRSMDLFLKYKGNIQKIIAYEGDQSIRLGEDGILRCGIKHLLERGFFSHGGIQ